MSNKPITAIEGTSVYVVLEYAKDPIVHGVYSNRVTAEAKREKLFRCAVHNTSCYGYNYIAVLKKTIEGKKLRITDISDRLSLISRNNSIRITKGKKQ